MVLASCPILSCLPSPHPPAWAISQTSCSSFMCYLLQPSVEECCCQLCHVKVEATSHEPAQWQCSGSCLGYQLPQYSNCSYKLATLFTVHPQLRWPLDHDGSGSNGSQKIIRPEKINKRSDSCPLCPIVMWLPFK